ncbi:hypothetical protein SALBM311S_12810 [Streptomyces alboniger]
MATFASRFSCQAVSNVEPVSSGPELEITVTSGYFASMAVRNCVNRVKNSFGRFSSLPTSRWVRWNGFGPPPAGVARGSASQASTASGSRAIASPRVSPRHRPMSQSRRASCTSGA